MKHFALLLRAMVVVLLGEWVMDRVKLPLRLFTLLGIVALIYGCGGQSAPSAEADGFTEYFGMAEPGLSPQVFAASILPPEGGVMHSSPAFSPDGTEVFFSVYFPDQQPRLDVIMFSEWDAGGWSPAQIAPFSGEFNDNWPWFARDGNRIYFSSQRPHEGGSKALEEYGLWYVESKERGWASPRAIASPADFGRDEGTIYVGAILPGGYGDMDIYRLAYMNGTYSMPENLGPAINSDAEEYGPCVAPDGSYLVFTRFEETGEPRVDLYVSFSRGDGTWSEAGNMGDTIGAFHGGRFPALSPDGKYLFFVAHGGKTVHWVDARVVEQFRPEE
jgi:hypothetical protein